MSPTKKEKKYTFSYGLAIGCVTGAVACALLSFARKLLSSSNQASTKPIESDAQQSDDYESAISKSKDMHSDEDMTKAMLHRTRTKTNYCYQRAPDSVSSLVMAVNILVEYLPNSMLEVLFSYLPDIPKAFAVSSHSQNGWDLPSSRRVLYDVPDVFVENVLPIRNQPSLVITVGLPGSGKTSWAKVRVDGRRVIAADDYFDEHNDGQFDPKLLSKAHEWAQDAVEKALKAGHSVAANNTNTTFSEMHAYVTKVVFGGFPHKMVFAVMPETNIKTLCGRGLHGVPPKKCKVMLKRMRKWMDKGPPTVAKVLRAGAFSPRVDPRKLAKEVIFTAVFIDERECD